MVKNVVIAALLAVIAIGSGALVYSQSFQTTNIEVRVWQRVSDLSDLYISARPAGGSWRTVGTVPLGEGQASAYQTTSNGIWRYSDITLAVALPDAPIAPPPVPAPTNTPTPTPASGPVACVTDCPTPSGTATPAAATAPAVTATTAPAVTATTAPAAAATTAPAAAATTAPSAAATTTPSATATTTPSATATTTPSATATTTPSATATTTPSATATTTPSATTTTTPSATATTTPSATATTTPPATPTRNPCQSEAAWLQTEYYRQLPQYQQAEADARAAWRAAGAPTWRKAPTYVAYIQAAGALHSLTTTYEAAYARASFYRPESCGR